MRLPSLRVALATIVTCTSPVLAQGGARCPLLIVDGVVQQPNAGPGVAFGVTAYQCASCGIKQEPGARTEHTFNAEPVVTQVESWSVLRPGDVLEAVNGHPITTRAGAEQFTYPPLTESILSVRRGTSRVEIKTSAREQCENLALLDPSKIRSVSVLKGNAAVSRYGVEAANGAVVVQLLPDTTVARLRRQYDSARAVRTVRPEPAVGEGQSEAPTAGRYGFAISCIPSCTRARASDGTDYWKFDGYPPIAGIRPAGPAAMAGLGVGDMITEIDGISILTEEGALRFQRAERKESMQVTILRRGARIGVTLKPR